MCNVNHVSQRRKRFNSLDYMTAYLYRHNPNHKGREDVILDEIPFVKEEWSIKYILEFFSQKS